MLFFAISEKYVEKFEFYHIHFDCSSRMALCQKWHLKLFNLFKLLTKLLAIPGSAQDKLNNEIQEILLF